MSPDALYELITTKAAAVDFVIVDVRRTDVDVRQFPAHKVVCESHSR